MAVSKFAGKVVLITGASSGNGAATAILFSKLGALVSLSGRNLENLERVAQQCKIFNPQSQPPFIMKAELTDESETKNLLQQTVEHFGPLDVLVNNAGIIQLGDIQNTSLAQYDKMFDTNVRSIYHLTHLAVPQLIESKGSIINVFSAYGIQSFPGVLAYSMSKAAIDQFTRCVALELKQKKVRVNNVNSGVTLNELQKREAMHEQEYKQFLARTKETHALGRPGQPNEVAQTVVFLASEDACFITGASIPVDGGRVIYPKEL